MSAFLIVEEGDGPDWLLHEVHATEGAAFEAAEAWKTRDLSNGGKPYTWVHIIEQAGADVLRHWRFNAFTQEWTEESPR